MSAAEGVGLVRSLPRPLGRPERLAFLHQVSKQAWGSGRLASFSQTLGSPAPAAAGGTRNGGLHCLGAQPPLRCPRLTCLGPLSPAFASAKAYTS